MYIQVRTRFLSALIIAILWLLFSIFVATNWVNDLSDLIGRFPAILVISVIAFIPGFMNTFLLASYLVDSRKNIKIHKLDHYPSISILIAAYNEEKYITDTIESITKQTYQGDIEIFVIDDGSTDKTLETLTALQLTTPNLNVIHGKHAGKAQALNLALPQTKNNLIITLDADTYLLPESIYQLIIHFQAVPVDTAATAGSTYVKNAKTSFMTRLQQWEYYQSIAAIKRVQSLLQGTLVAQGSFSLYQKEKILEVGGWPDTVGEDIVLTWKLLTKGYRITHAEHAIAFTNVPVTYKEFFYQRSRWSRGMLEAFHHNPSILLQPRLSTLVIYWDLLFPLIDFTYLLVFIPGIIAAFFGYFYIAGPMTIAVLPIAFLQNMIFYAQQKKTFQDIKINVHGGFFSFLIYMLFYNALMVVACIHGYISEVFNFEKKWGTK